jgi:hypothetical protein
MNPKNLYTLFYRQGEKGATNGLIEASSLRIAQAVGEHFCNSEMGRKFIRVQPSLLASEDDLPAETLEALTKPVTKPGPDAEGAEDSNPNHPKAKPEKNRPAA